MPVKSTMCAMYAFFFLVILLVFPVKLAWADMTGGDQALSLAQNNAGPRDHHKSDKEVDRKKHSLPDHARPHEKERQWPSDLVNTVKRQQMREMLMNLPPEERRERIEELRQQHQQNIAENRKERRARFEQQWNQSQETERAMVCDNVRRQCTEAPESYTCQIAEDFCASY